ncbi:condensation domain-containing protein [Actinocrispum wychmicini]|uniref:Amino acid adenylation domain-containing protein n=1 Tax=Actinocrispum wychmicini TaxID=1213861 RepID=A0A4R2JP54_9PSEU|nr:condensation domain-containing protein [Actinocrispum wychmicini]TCO61923.1 amino acid adenylation domain-containing protein [Actinocrispum wychmicini]
MTDPVAADGQTTAAIREILGELVGNRDVDPDLGFRKLGGDSIRAVKAVGRIAVEFGTSDETNELLLEALLDGASATLLAGLVDGMADRTGTTSITVPAEDNPLSYNEERLWLAQRYHPASPAYNVVNAFHVVGDLDLPALDRAAQALVARHPALSTQYTHQDPGLADCGITATADIAHRDDRQSPAEVLASARADADMPFDLAEGRLLRLRTYATADGGRLLLVVVHHIATDGWSMDLIYRELTDLYAGRELGPAPAGYREFAQTQRRSREPLASADKFAARLVPAPDRVELSPDRQRPPARSMAGEILRTRLPAATADRLRTLADETGTSLYVVLLAMFYLCLARCTRQWDLLIGTVVAARTEPEYQNTVGFFANTVPIRASAAMDTTIVDLLDKLWAESRWVLSHQNVPLEELAVRIRRAADRAHSPLVDVVMVLQNNDSVTPRFAGCAVTPVPLHTGTAKFDLMLEVTPVGAVGDLDLGWEYATDVLNEGTVAELAATFDQLSTSITEPAATVRSVVGVRAGERARIAAVNDTARSWPEMDVSVRFDDLADADPGALALLDGPVTVSRTELRALRDGLARRLDVSGVRAGDVVVVHLPRSARSVAALFATWRVGAVPMFVDVHHPREHRDILVRACRPAAVLTDEIDGWAVGTRIVAVVDAEQEAPPGKPAVRRELDDPAWLVATSGSTGPPKITVGTHRSLHNRCYWAWDAFPYTAGEVAALRTPVGFVDAIAETVVPLLAGVPLAIVPDRAVWDASELVDVMSHHRVTRLLATPSILRHLLDAYPDLASVVPTLAWLMCSGEPLDAGLLVRLRTALPGTRLVNLYGSSEVAGDATCVDVTELPATMQVPLGRPIANAGVLVVDDVGEPVPMGVVGELVVTGAPVGRGYLVDGHVTLTEGYRDSERGRVYRTGDLGRLGADGRFYFVGRRDRQVKVRGCRVELGQVEATMLGLPGVRQAAAWVQSGPDGAVRIDSAVVPAPGCPLVAAEVRAGLRDLVPSYMVPSRVAVVDVLPLNVNGKLDRAATGRLSARLEPDASDTSVLTLQQQYVRQIWASLLAGEVAGLDENFFALGGDSLAVNTMLATLVRDTGVSVDVGAFLGTPTIRALADRLVGVAATILAERVG